MDETRTLHSAHGSLNVQRLGAMLAPARFDLPSGQTVEPFHIAPWTDDGSLSKAELLAIPGLCDTYAVSGHACHLVLMDRKTL